MPAILQRLTRHAHISTTLSFYVCLTANAMAGDLWANHGATVDNTGATGNTFGNTGPKHAENMGLETSDKSLYSNR
jgi:hypothetical protein